jgi:predicted thioesterase
MSWIISKTNIVADTEGNGFTFCAEWDWTHVVKISTSTASTVIVKRSKFKMKLEQTTVKALTDNLEKGITF